MLRLEARFIDKLLSEPESGMGFQYVEVGQTRGGRASGIVINSGLLVLEEDLVALVMRSGTIFELRARTAESSVGKITDVRVTHGASPRAAVRERITGAAPTREAKDAPIEKTTYGQVFKRFSAYENDLRVRPDGSLLPGTYATTEEDARNVRTGSEAIIRYALPNSKPASWVFTSRPASDTTIQRGIVAPANDQPGGGVEVIFPHGTQPRTTSGPVKIPD